MFALDDADKILLKGLINDKIKQLYAVECSEKVEIDNRSAMVDRLTEIRIKLSADEPRCFYGSGRTEAGS